MKSLITMTIAQFKIFTRNRTLLVASLGIATISMFIFGFLFGNSSNQPLNIGIADMDKSATSAQVITAMEKAADLKVEEGQVSSLIDEIKNGQLSAVVVLPEGFASGLRQGKAQAQLYVDQTNIISAARSQGTINGIFDAIGKQVSGYKDVIQVEEKQISVHEQRAIDVLTPGMLGLTILYANIYAGITLATWRMSGTLKRMSATPLKAWQLIMAQIFSQFLLSLAETAIVLLIAVTVFQVQVSLAMLPTIALFVIAGAFSVIALGYVVGNFVRQPSGAQAVATLIALPMMFLGGSYFPVSATGALKVVVEITPLTHINRAFQQIMLDGAGLSTLLPELGVLLLTGLLLLLLSVRTFRWSW